MNKPILKHHHEKAYDYNELINYIEQKYKVQVRDYENYYKGDMSSNEFHKDYEGKPRLDFWDWFTDNHDVIYNGVYVDFDILNHYEEISDDYKTPVWVREILKMIIDEFEIKNSDINLYIWW